ncbi:MAG: hypothetical protein VKK42_03900 [Lyngbya sp.]|nr:hypothetical protein [Lyngbya sp.]
MARLQVDSRKLWSKSCPSRFSLAVATLLTPFYVLTACFASLAEGLPALLSVAQYEGTVHFKEGTRIPERLTEEMREGIRLETPNQQLQIATSSRAGFIFRDRSDQKLHTNAIIGGSIHNPTEYWYPCSGTGGFTIAWEEGNQSTPCKSFRVSSKVAAEEASQGGWQNTLVAQVNNSFLKAQNLEIDLDLPNIIGLPGKIEYCNAIADSGKGWGFGPSSPEQIFNQLFSSDNPCQTALEKCSTTSEGSGCSVTSWATWNFQDRDLVASMQCDRNPPSSVRGTGETIAVTVLWGLLQEALRSQAGSCELNVYRSDEIIISPVDDRQTLVHTESSQNGLIEVNVIEGAVEIRATTNLQASVRVSEGERIFYGNNEFFKQGSIDPRQVASSPSVQGFLNSENWPQDFQPQLEEYQDVDRVRFDPRGSPLP